MLCNPNDKRCEVRQWQCECNNASDTVIGLYVIQCFSETHEYSQAQWLCNPNDEQYSSGRVNDASDTDIGQ